jgi:hypothetical protein
VPLLPPQIGVERADPAFARQGPGGRGGGRAGAPGSAAGGSAAGGKDAGAARRGLEAARVDAGRAYVEGEVPAALPQVTGDRPKRQVPRWLRRQTRATAMRAHFTECPKRPREEELPPPYDFAFTMKLEGAKSLTARILR